MPAPHPPEFRRRAVEFAREVDEDGSRKHPVAQLARDLKISESCLRNWMAAERGRDRRTPGSDARPNARSWSGCGARTGCCGWSVICSLEPRPSSPRRTSCPGSDVRVHRRGEGHRSADEHRVGVPHLRRVDRPGSTSGGAPRLSRARVAAPTPSCARRSGRSTASRAAPTGRPRVHAELRLGMDVRVGRKRVERLMRADGSQGVTRRRRRGLTSRDAAAIPNDDLVARRFRPTAPTSCGSPTSPSTPPTTARSTAQSVIDAWNRQVVGHSIADHLRAELVVDALDMACWRQRPVAGQTVHHSDHGTQYTSWAFGQRLRSRGPVGLDGHRRRRARQRRRRELLRHAPDRAPRPAPLDATAASSPRRSSSGSRSSTTSTAGTRPSACSPPSPTPKHAQTEPAA